MRYPSCCIWEKLDTDVYLLVLYSFDIHEPEPISGESGSETRTTLNMYVLVIRSRMLCGQVQIMMFSEEVRT